MAALYIHIPFCRSKCRYCDFYSETQLSLLDPFLQALTREIELSGPAWDLTFSTIYFGGGTPSLLAATQITAILEQLYLAFAFAPECEISLEANPGSAVRHLAEWRAAGIHRLTIGIQSFDDADLHFLGRRHSAAEALEAMRAARAAGFANVGIDLIYGLPGQSERWTSTLRTAISLQPDHISAYGLTWEQNTPLWRMLQRGEVQKCAEEKERDMFLTAMRMLAEAGYEQYEISNFCRPGFRSRHNSAYWDLRPYLGLGPAAHSFCDGRRWWNVRDLQTYIARLGEGVQPIEDKETLTPADRARELILLGLRRREGIDLAVLSQLLQKDKGALKEQLWALFGGLAEMDPFERSLADELLTCKKDRIGVTQQGLLLYDSICEKLFSLVNEKPAARQAKLK